MPSTAEADANRRFPAADAAGYARAVVLPLALLCLAIAIVGGYAYKAAHRAAIRDAALNMEAVARLKADEIRLWLAERSEAARLVASPLFVKDLEAWLAGGRRDRALEARLRERMEHQRGTRYRHLALFSPSDGREWLDAGMHPDLASASAKALEAVRSNRPVFDDSTAASLDVLLAATVYYPVYGTDGKTLIAAVGATMEMREVVLPLIQPWQGASRSAETVLVRREGEEIVFFNSLRGQSAKPLLHRSMNEADLIGARVVAGGPGFYAGNDYRGVPSLAYGVPVPGSSWHVIAKMDRSEVEEGVDAVAAFCAVMLAAFTAGVAWWLTKRRQAEVMQSAYVRTIGILSECNRALAQATSEPALLEAVCRLIVEVGGHRMAWICVPEDGFSARVKLAASHGWDGRCLDPDLACSETSGDACPTVVALRERRTQVMASVHASTPTPWRTAALACGCQSCVSLPLLDEGRVLGALSIYSAIPKVFAVDEVRLLEDLARDVARGMATLRLRAAHRATEAALKLNEERLRALFGSISDAIFVHGVRPGGKPGCFFEVNDIACQRLGYSREELLRMGPSDIDAPGCPDNPADIIKRLLAEGNLVFESVHVAKDGRRIPVEISSSTFVVRGERAFVSVARDITERRRHEDERAESERQLATLSAHLQSVREDERARVARELHDELGQVLTALKFDVSALKAQLPAASDLSAKMDSVIGIVDGTLESVRRIAADLRPTMLDDLGLAAAIDWLVEEFERRHPEIEVKLVLALGRIEVDGPVATAAYRIVQECLTNVARHAKASKLHVVVGTLGEGRLSISIQDNGRGIQGPRSGGFGLLGMRQRVQALGGTLTMESIPGEGVSVDVEIPLPAVAGVEEATA